MHVLTLVLSKEKLPELLSTVCAIEDRWEVEDALEETMSPSEFKWFGPAGEDPGEWDYWSVGGRWEECFERLVYKTEDLPKDFIPCVVVTPDGEWIQNFAYNKDKEHNEEKENWREEYKSLLDKWPNTYAVIVDCHV